MLQGRPRYEALGARCQRARQARMKALLRRALVLWVSVSVVGLLHCEAQVPRQQEGAREFPDTCEGVSEDTSSQEPRSEPERPTRRATARQCERARPCPPIEIDERRSQHVCRAHADCAAGVNGRCERGGFQCSYDECFEDADCSLDELCDCNGGRDGAHYCVLAACRTDADCAGDFGCSSSRADPCRFIGVDGYFCKGPADLCQGDDDCPPGQGCAFDTDHWECKQNQCAR